MLCVMGYTLLNSLLGSNDKENSKRFKETAMERFHKGSGVYSSAFYLKYLFILSPKHKNTGTLPQIAYPLGYFISATGLTCVKA